MMLPASVRFSLRLVRAGLHAAVVFTASLSLLLLFLLWSVLQLFDEHETSPLAGRKAAARAIAKLD